MIQSQPVINYKNINIAGNFDVSTLTLSFFVDVPFAPTYMKITRVAYFVQAGFQETAVYRLRTSIVPEIICNVVAQGSTEEDTFALFTIDRSSNCVFVVTKEINAEHSFTFEMMDGSPIAPNTTITFSMNLEFS